MVQKDRLDPRLISELGVVHSAGLSHMQNSKVMETPRLTIDFPKSTEAKQHVTASDSYPEALESPVNKVQR